jgi:hypothetical protein
MLLYFENFQRWQDNDVSNFSEVFCCYIVSNQGKVPSLLGKGVVSELYWFGYEQVNVNSIATWFVVKFHIKNQKDATA